MTAKEMLGKVDHTQLKAFATWEDIQKLCDEAIQYHTASVCVPPCYIKRIHDTYGDKINICTVVGFPLGYSVTEAKVAEVRKALEDGCNEIDMVVNISDVKNGLLDKVEEEIRTLKKECGHHILKVIIETCYLTEEEKIAMCKAVTNAGADFIKTSTGFGTGGATKEDVELFTYIQFLFFRQWTALKSYINSLGIGIIGDLPIYVAMDSADVWAEPESFQLDDQCVPTEVSGVPPDYFSADGQLWGNPLYAWDRMQDDGFGWWIRRVDGASKLYDVIRIDHFRGFEAYWAVPYGETTAKNGHWVKGPGMNLVGVLTGWFPQLRFIAEDLGYPTPGVRQLLQDSGLPGMKVLEFAFDSRDTSSYLPHSYGENCVCYTGTHDNSPLALWKDEAAPEDIAYAREYLGLNDAEGFNWGIIRGGMSSVARLFVAQMQDYLELGLHHRTNVPGTQSGNWQWRLLPGEATPALARRIRRVTELYGR